MRRPRTVCVDGGAGRQAGSERAAAPGVRHSKSRATVIATPGPWYAVGRPRVISAVVPPPPPSPHLDPRDRPRRPTIVSACSSDTVVMCTESRRRRTHAHTHSHLTRESDVPPRYVHHAATRYPNKRFSDFRTGFDIAADMRSPLHQSPKGPAARS